MSAVPSELWPYLALLLVGFLPNEAWRWLGLLVARGLDEDSEIVLWARGVATAILAAVMAQLIATNSGVLATTPLAVRIGATAAGILAFLVIRRSISAGVVVGEGVLVLGSIVFGQ